MMGQRVVVYTRTGIMAEGVLADGGKRWVGLTNASLVEHTDIFEAEKVLNPVLSTEGHFRLIKGRRPAFPSLLLEDVIAVFELSKESEEVPR